MEKETEKCSNENVPIPSQCRTYFQESIHDLSGQSACAENVIYEIVRDVSSKSDNISKDLCGDSSFAKGNKHDHHEIYEVKKSSGLSLGHEVELETDTQPLPARFECKDTEYQKNLSDHNVKYIGHSNNASERKTSEHVANGASKCIGNVEPLVESISVSETSTTVSTMRSTVILQEGVAVRSEEPEIVSFEGPNRSYLGMSSTSLPEGWEEERSDISHNGSNSENRERRQTFSSCPALYVKVKNSKCIQINQGPIQGQTECQDRWGSDQSVGAMYNITPSNTKKTNITARTSTILRDNRLKNLFVERNGFRKAESILLGKQFLFIIGERGDGRKWMAYSLMKRRIENSQECIPYILYDVSDWDECINADEHFVVCLEDIFGIDTLDVEMVRKWERRFKSILLCAENNNDIIVTMSKTIYYHMAALDLNAEVMKENVVDLSCADYQLSEGDMREILKKHILNKDGSLCKKQNTAVMDEKWPLANPEGLDEFVDKCIKVSSPMGFPNQANKFALVGSTNSRGSDFFSDPSQKGVREIERMIASKQQYDIQRAFSLLSALINMYGMNVEEMLQTLGPMTLSKDKMFEDEKDGDPAHVPKSLLNLLLDFADKHNFRGRMLEYLELGVSSLAGSYIRRVKYDIYRFNGPKIEAEVWIGFLRQNPSILIKYLKDEDFCRFVRPASSSNGPAYEFDMSDVSIRTIVMERLTIMCAAGCVKQVVEHAVIRQRAFAEAFVQYVSREGKIDDILQVKDHGSQLGILETSLQYEFIGPKSDSSINLADTILKRLAKFHREGTPKEKMSSWFKNMLERLFFSCCTSNVFKTCEILLKTWDIFEPNVLAQALKIAAEHHSDSVLMQLLNIQIMEKISTKEKNEALRLMLINRRQSCNETDDAKELLEEFIRMGADLNFNPPGERPLLHALISNDNINVFRLVLNFGVSTNCRDNFDQNPMHFAAREGKSNFAEELLSRNIDMKSLDSDGLMAIHLASESRSIDIVSQIVERYPNMVHALDKCSRLPLHYAKNKKIARFLITNGADVNAKDAEGNTPLHRSVLIDNVDLLKVLIKNGGDLDSKNNKSRVPLLLACELGKVETVRFILKSYDTSNDETKELLSLCLTKATKKDQDPVVQILLESGASAKPMDVIAAGTEKHEPS